MAANTVSEEGTLSQMQGRRMSEEWKRVLLKGFTLLLLHKVVAHNKAVHNKLKNCGVGEAHR